MFSFLHSCYTIVENGYIAVEKTYRKVRDYVVETCTISPKSALNFVYVNSFLLATSYAMHKHHIFFVSTLSCNVVLMAFIYVGTRHKPAISSLQRPPPTFTTRTADIAFLFASSFIQAVFHEVILHNYPVAIVGRFLPLKLLLFELVFDLVHYTTHRLSHTVYYGFHKVHHWHAHPTLINTFCHHPVDLFLMDCVPTLVAFWVFSGVFDAFQVQLILVYKAFIEISGHCGNSSLRKSLADKPLHTGSFPLCIWLPRLLCIELITEDHDLHHSIHTCNYGKRFSLWDKLFFTYRRVTE